MRFFKNISILCIIFVILFSISIKSLANDESYIWSTIETSTTPEKVNTSTVETNSEIQENNSLNLESGSAILIEQTTGKVLYAHNIHEQLRPASVTKVMSILLIM